MKLLQFELIKALKQKKYLWVFLIVVLVTGAIFSMNSYQRSRLQGNWAMHTSIEELTPLWREWSSRESDLIIKRDKEGLTEAEEKQLEYSREVGLALQRLNMVMFFGMEGRFNQHYQRLLDSLDMYSKYGGEFTPLEGIDRDIARELHNWRVKYNIDYENERSPVTQHLFLRQSASILLGIIGLIVLLFFFGNTITEEKEQLTWKTLKVQPISQGKLIIAKYINFLLMMLLFIGVVIGIGLIIPLIFEGRTLVIQYPHVLRTEEQFIIISTVQYIIRNIVFFACGSSILFGFSILISKWIKKSTSMYFFTALLLVSGYVATSSLVTPFNPFSILNVNSKVSQMPNYDMWVYVLSTGIWMTILLLLAIYIPEPEFLTKKGQSDVKAFNQGETKFQYPLSIKLIIFELRKIKREGLIKAFAFLMLLLIIGGNFFLAAQKEERESAYISELNFRVRETNNRINRYEEILGDLYVQREELEQDENLRQELFNPIYRRLIDINTHISELERLLKLEYMYIEKLEAGILAYDEEDWNTFYQYQLFANEKAFEIIYPNGIHSGWPETLRRFTKLVSIHEKQLLMERNIRPVLSGEFISTIHEFWGSQTRTGWNGERVRQEQWAYENKRVDNSGLFYLYHSFTSYAFLLPLVILIFILGGGIAKEKGKKRTFNFLKTQPISQEKMFLAKSINGFVFMAICIVGVALLVILTGTIKSRFGDWDFPILHYNSFRSTLLPEYRGFVAGGHGYNFINLGDYLIRATILFLFVGAFVFAVSMLLSLFFKRSISVYSATFILLAVGYWLNARKRLQISQISPFTYFDIPKIINGELATRLNNPSFNVVSGIILLALLSMLTIGIGYWYASKNKDFDFKEKIFFVRKSFNK